MWRMYREDCHALGLTCRQPQGVHTHRMRALLTVHAVDDDACALGRFVRPSRDQPPAAHHPLDLHSSPGDSCTHPAACTCLHMCTTCHRSLIRHVPTEPESKGLGDPLLSLSAASHSNLHCTQACPSISTSHADSQKAQPHHQVMQWQPPDGCHKWRQHTQ